MLQKWLVGLIASCLFVIGQGYCLAQAPANEGDLLELLAKIRANDAKVADLFEKSIAQAKRDIEQFNRGHLIFGQVLVEGENAARKEVISQMKIHPGGYFVDAAGVPNSPIGFRIHGYEAVDISPKGPGPVEDLGIIRIKPLPADKLATAKGQVKIGSSDEEVTMDKVDVVWTIDANPQNSATGGSRGGQSPKLRAKVDADGKYSMTGLSPARYTVTYRAPGYAQKFRRVQFQEGQTLELEPITLDASRKIDIEFAVASKLDFRDAKISKSTTLAGQRWCSTDDKADEDLVIRQQNKRLILSSSVQPVLLIDLGAAELKDKLNVAIDIEDKNWGNDVVAENGHVYLVHHNTSKRWVLFRTTFSESP